MMSKDEYKEKIMELCNRKPEEYALDWLSKVNEADVKIVFGGGVMGRSWISILKNCGLCPDYICDNNRDYWGMQIEGIKCIAPDDLLTYKNMVIVLALKEYQAVYEQLIQMNIKSESIMIATPNTNSFEINYMISKNKMDICNLCKDFCAIADVCEDELSVRIIYQTLKNWLCHPSELVDYTGESYFIPEIEKNEHEIFVDAGAFDGDTLESFLKIYGDKFDKYYAFELNKENYEKLCCKVEALPALIREKVTVYNLGLWSEKKEIGYNNNFQITKVDSHGDCIGIVDRLDHILPNEEITFIKMDIEGAETEALIGCLQHIENRKPVLAISIYHSLNDFIKIPLLLTSYGYKLIIRHHATDCCDIVCYAYK